jgi:DNA-directed RNA polymerase subunit RPC12/RpoP
VLVGVALRNLRNKSGFHQCPRCKSRSVWKADPHGTVEETLHYLLRLCPYRCARCDKRFMDAKAPRPDDPKPRVTRWMAYAKSKASRVFGSNDRSPFDNVLKLNFAVPPRPTTPQISENAMTESVEHLSNV